MQGIRLVRLAEFPQLVDQAGLGTRDEIVEPERARGRCDARCHQQPAAGRQGVVLELEQARFPACVSAAGVDVGDNYNVLRIGPTLVASRMAPVGDSGAVVPYGSLGLMFSRVSVGDADESDFSFPLRVGVEVRAMPEFRFLAELQVNVGDDFNDDVGGKSGLDARAVTCLPGPQGVLRRSASATC